MGIPHPFDRLRGSLLRDERMAELAGQVDWVETYNARLLGGTGNDLLKSYDGWSADTYLFNLGDGGASIAHRKEELRILVTACCLMAPIHA